MEDILLVGGGGHCKSLIDVIELENKFNIVGIIDKKELIGTKILNYEVIACDDELQELSKMIKYAVISVGQIKTADLRIKLFELTKLHGFLMPSIISPRAYVSKHASIGEGSVVFHDALINANARIGKNCIINSKALIEHDCLIGDNCHVSTGVIINGGVQIEDNCFIGSNGTTKEDVVIETNSFIKAGSVVK